jgi:pyruvate formate lyase activating enzyme
MILSGLVKSSLIDFPGLVACVLFVPGCNYDCFYCHNRMLIDGSHETLDEKQVFAFLKKRAGFLDGVVISGGEPTLQPDLMDDIKEIRRLGYKVKLDTNGSSPGTVEKLLREGLCDYFAVDYKAPAARYREICGGASDAQNVLRTIQTLLDFKADFEVRTTVIPQLKEEDLAIMARELPIVPRYVLNRYRKPELFLPCDAEKVEQTPYGQDQVVRFSEVLRACQPNTTA